MAFWTFTGWPATRPDGFSRHSTRDKDPAFNPDIRYRVNRELAHPLNPKDCWDSPLSNFNLKFSLCYGRSEAASGWTPPQRFADYLTSTLPPASSNFFLAASLSALFAPSNRLGRAFDQRFGFRQAETSFDLAHGFDDGNLFVSRGRQQNYVKRGFRFSGRRSGAARRTTCSRDRDWRSGRHAPFLFQFLDQVGGLQDRQLAQFLYDVCDFCHNYYLRAFLFVSSSPAATGDFSSRPANRRFTIYCLCFCYFRRRLLRLKTCSKASL
jgi:hypothetical protein